MTHIVSVVVVCWGRADYISIPLVTHVGCDGHMVLIHPGCNAVKETEGLCNPLHACSGAGEDAVLDADLSVGRWGPLPSACVRATWCLGSLPRSDSLMLNCSKAGLMKNRGQMRRACHSYINII